MPPESKLSNLGHKFDVVFIPILVIAKLTIYLLLYLFEVLSSYSCYSLLLYASIRVSRIY